MSQSLALVQIVLAIVLVALILTQSRGSAFTGSFNNDPGATYRTRRGLELFVFRLTIVTAVLFVVVSLIASLTPATA